MAEYAPIETLRFRQALSELDGIVNKLESNTLELEESLDLYKRGIDLLASLKGRLDGAQQEVDSLIGQLDARGDDAATDATLS